jgi:hypothetical protein
VGASQMKKSIMPTYSEWSTEYFEGSHKHHIFGGSNRKLSEKYGLFVYLTPAMHNMSNKGIHFNKEFMDYAHKEGQKAYMKHYSSTKEEFISKFGRNYL